MTVSPEHTNKVTMTESAAKRIMELALQENETPSLRVSVRGGGCSGFSYDFAFDANSSGDDVIIERDGAAVLVDAVSLIYLEGSQIYFVEDLIGQSFQIQNPNATSSCGCGTSFSI